MAVIEIHRGGPGKKEFFFRLMGKNYKEIWRSSETYKRKATMLKTMANYLPGLQVSVVDLTTKEMSASLGPRHSGTKFVAPAGLRKAKTPARKAKGAKK